MGYPEDLLANYSIGFEPPNFHLHRQVRNIVSSYNSAWDILTELLQNAVDAINQRKRTDPAFSRGTIKITIDANNSLVRIEDNGSGLPEGASSRMLLPGGTFKTMGNTYGHKGLGFTYCAHISDEVEVESEEATSGHRQHWTFNKGFSWLNDPAIDAVFAESGGATIRTIPGPGTAIQLKLAIGRYESNQANTAVLDRFFEWADDEKLLSFVLRTRTAVGQVGWMFREVVPVDIDIQVTLTNSGITFPVEYSFFQFGQQPPLNQETYPSAIDYATNVYLNPRVPNKTHYGIYHLFDSDPTAPSTPLKVGRHHGGVRFKAFVFICGKDNLATALKNYDPRLGDRHKDLAITTDVHLAIDGMPCGVPIDSWNNFGSHEQRYFAMLNTDLSFGQVLDAGRKTITKYYVDLLTEKVVDAASDKNVFGGGASLYELSAQLHTKASTPLSRSPIEYIRKWLTFPPLTGSRLLQNLPDDELGVYLLFGELVGRGLLPGYKLLYVSGGATYDAALEYNADMQDLANLNETAGGTCPLGIGSAAVERYRRSGRQYRYQNPATGQTHLVAEFKVRAEELLREIQKRNSEKDMDHIDILVCISFDPTEITNLRGAVVPVIQASRSLPGITHTLSFGGHSAYMICLVDALRAI